MTLKDRLAKSRYFGAEATHANVFRINCMTRRKDPIFYAVHCGYPTMDTQGTMR